MSGVRFDFDPTAYEPELVAIIEEIRALDGPTDDRSMSQLLRRHPKAGRGAFSKTEIIRGYRTLAPQYGWSDEPSFLARVRMKPVRTLSGVAPVTVLTKPFPCPGKCIFCPSDVKMPKSYLSREPGAQRAAQYQFDPYRQALGRLLAFHATGHRVNKVELIILGGTWSFYPEAYQIWFVKRCFDAMNDFEAARRTFDEGGGRPDALAFGGNDIDFRDLDETIDGLAPTRTYNQVISTFLQQSLDGSLLTEAEQASWHSLEAVHERNERASARCVGLVVETRPDHLSPAEVERIRRLGCTKVQIGFQSLSDAVLAANNRGHDTAATRRAVDLLRQAGFKLHAHWMPNLYGSDPAHDVVDFARMFEDPAYRPDELKIYPCSLIESAELMAYHADGRWHPYREEELLAVLSECLLTVPEYCRVTRMIRDIPGDDIVTGNKTTNFREVVEAALAQRGLASRDIRAREVRGRTVQASEVRLEEVVYETSIGEERFLQIVTANDEICGFCRLSLPCEPVFLDEIAGSAMLREVHVYGRVAGFEAGATNTSEHTARTQHVGLGRRLVEAAATRAVAAGFEDLAVIAAVGTRDYYRGLGFRDGVLYQHRQLSATAQPADR